MNNSIKKVELKDNESIFIIENDRYIGSHIEITKTYYEEQDVLFILKSLLKKKLIIYDMGANIGNHSLYFSRKMKTKRIYSFEPSPFVFSVLKKNASLVNNIDIFNVGLGNAELVLDFYAFLHPDGKINWGSCRSTVPKDLRTVYGEKVNIVRLDDFFKNNKLLPPDFIKIDVEGYELELLKGAIKILKTYKPIILLESFQDKYDEVNSFLQELGYIKIMDFPYSNYLYINPENTKMTSTKPNWLHKLKQKLKRK